MFRKTLLALMIIAGLPVIAATDRTIYVTTLNDENGENANACSLREAVTAATLNKAYGGCSTGQADITDQIVLKEGVYQLNSTLIIGSNLNITGASPVNYSMVEGDPITNSYPLRGALKTTIQGKASFSLFDSTASRASLGLNYVILKDGSGEYGGALFVGGNTTLNSVTILASKASRSGGAVYLAGSNASLNSSDTLFKGNQASAGAVIGMSCIDNVKWTPHSIVLDRTSIIENGDVNSNSIIAYCGTPTATINASTIAKNSAKNSILQYIHDPENPDPKQIFPLHPTSTLTLTSNTIVENASLSTLLYDNVGRLSLKTNVLAYNLGKSCRYNLGREALIKLDSSENSNIDSAYNAFNKPTFATDDVENQGECDLPSYILKNNLDRSTNLRNISIDTVLGKLIRTDDPNISLLQAGLTPYYFPKALLIDAGEFACSGTDQRALNRRVDDTTDVTTKNKCDIGSIERGVLSAINIVGVSNTIVAPIITQYEDNIKSYESFIKNQYTDANLIDRFKYLLNEANKQLTALKETQHYRQVYANIFSGSIEYEKLNSNGIPELQKFNEDKYNVITEPLGSGPQQFIEKPDESLLKGDKDELNCDWNPVLRQILIYRKNSVSSRGASTPSGDFEYCKYSIVLKEDNMVISTAYIQATIVNIAPIANDDSYTVKYGSNQEIQLDILANDNDNGDGAPSLGAKGGYPVDSKPFFEDASTKRFANIKITTPPTQGKLIFEYEQPCPDNSATRPALTCYGGKITYKANNIFSPFNDSFKYKVLDSELLESNEATVNIVNTATTSDDTRNSGSSGGSLGIFSIIGLLGLITLKRKMN